MKTFALMFSFVPIILAYKGPASEIKDWAFATILLLAFAIEVIGAFFTHASRASSDLVDMAYISEMVAAGEAGDMDRLRQVKRSFWMFRDRGAA